MVLCVVFLIFCFSVFGGVSSGAFLIALGGMSSETRAGTFLVDDVFFSFVRGFAGAFVFFYEKLYLATELQLLSDLFFF